jgi:hypothetical protein
MASTDLVVASYDLKFSNIFRNESAKKANNRIAVFGQFLKDKGEANILRFKILDMKTGIEVEKIIPLSYMEQNDIAQIIILKTKDFLDNSMLGKLSISSTPLGLNIKLDKKPSGITPKEFFLRAGKYSVEIEGKYLKPFKTNAVISPGKTVNIRKKMEFLGLPTRYWLLGAFVTTWELIVVGILEDRLDREYRNEGTSYDKYRAANYAKITLLSISGIAWIGTGFCYFSNKAIKKRNFKE